MALVDRNRRYVAINGAWSELFQHPRAEMIGSFVGRITVDDDEGRSDAEWEQLLRTNEIYAERVVAQPGGALIHISYAAHPTTVAGQWFALFVTVSARVEPDGTELIGINGSPAAGTSSARPALALTSREREVVRHVALGASTRRIAAELYLSPATVRSHVRNAMIKTGAHTRAQLVAIMLGHGLVEA